jgi:hypothetical protein
MSNYRFIWDDDSVFMSIFLNLIYLILSSGSFIALALEITWFLCFLIFSQIVFHLYHPHYFMFVCDDDFVRNHCSSFCFRNILISIDNICVNYVLIAKNGRLRCVASNYNLWYSYLNFGEYVESLLTRIKNIMMKGFLFIKLENDT